MSQRDRFFYDVRQYGVITRKDGKALVLQLPAHCGDVANMWTLPGGKLEPTDAPTEGLLREITEETALEVSDVELFQVQRWATENSEKLGLFYTAKTLSEDLLLSSEHKAAQWVDVKEAETLTFYRKEVADILRCVLSA